MKTNLINKIKGMFKPSYTYDVRFEVWKGVDITDSSYINDVKFANPVNKGEMFHLYPRFSAYEEIITVKAEVLGINHLAGRQRRSIIRAKVAEEDVQGNEILPKIEFSEIEKYLKNSSEIFDGRDFSKLY